MTDNDNKCEYATPNVLDGLLSKMGIIENKLCKCKSPEPCDRAVDLGYSKPFAKLYCGKELGKNYPWLN